MNILILGPQGSGKGTQGRLLANSFGFFYLESGGFLREIAFKNEKLRHLLAEGKLVPDEEMSSYISSYLDSKGIYDNIIFEGFPRTLPQYNFFKSWLKDKNVVLNIALVLQVSEEETMRRLSARRMDPSSGKIYNLLTDKPPANIDPDSLVQREDDKPMAIKKRLAWYKREVEPLISELKREITLVEIDGERPIGLIYDDLVGILEEKGAKLIDKLPTD